MQTCMRVLALASLVAVSACAARPPGDVVAAPPAVPQGTAAEEMPGLVPPAELQIRLHQDVALFGETTMVLLRGDGRFEIETRSKATGQVSDRSQGSVSPSQVQALVNTMLANGFLEMPDVYRAPRRTIAVLDDGSYMHAIIITADGSCTELSLHLAAWQKSTRECNTAPEPLKQLHGAVWKLVRGDE